MLSEIHESFNHRHGDKLREICLRFIKKLKINVIWLSCTYYILLYSIYTSIFLILIFNAFNYCTQLTILIIKKCFSSNNNNHAYSCFSLLCVYVCMFLCICVHVCVFAYLCVCLCACTCVYMCVSACVFTCLCVRVVCSCAPACVSNIVSKSLLFQSYFIYYWVNVILLHCQLDWFASNA